MVDFWSMARGAGQIIVMGEHTIERIIKDFYGVEGDIAPLVSLIQQANPHLGNLNMLVSGAPLNLPILATAANNPPEVADQAPPAADQATDDQAPPVADQDQAPLADQTDQDQDSARKKSK